MMNSIFAYSCMFVKIGRLINLYNILLLLFIKMQKNIINIALHNFKIKCTRNETELTFQNCKF